MFKRFTSMFAVLVLLVLTACGGTPAAQQVDPNAKRTVQDALGKSVEVPANPQRIVVLTQEDLDAVLALEMKPVGLTNAQGQSNPPRYLADRIAGIAVIGDLLRPNMESLLAAKPDLILAGDMNDEAVLAELRKIAPTVITLSETSSWKDQFKLIGAVLGKADQATTLMGQYDQKVTEIKGGLGSNAGTKVSLVRWNPTGPSYMLKDQFASTVLLDLGFTRPANQQEPGVYHSKPLSLEKLAEIDGDWLFLSSLTPDGQEAMDSAKTTPVFQQLGAAKNNHVVAVEGEVWSTRGGYFAAQKVLADVQKAVAIP